MTSKGFILLNGLKLYILFTFFFFTSIRINSAIDSKIRTKTKSYYLISPPITQWHMTLGHAKYTHIENFFKLNRLFVENPNIVLLRLPTFTSSRKISKNTNLRSKKDDSSTSQQQVITITPKAINHLQILKEEKSPFSSLNLRLGVKTGGCSGLSYSMNIITEESINDSDYIDEYPQYGFNCIIDSKSIFYVIGMELDYSEELIAGGFRFNNPNASRKCGCGMSFGVPRNFSSSNIKSYPKRCS